MKRALHPKLAKRAVSTNLKTGRSRLHEYPASKLIHDVRLGWGGEKRLPLAKRRKDLKILDRAS